LVAPRRSSLTPDLMVWDIVGHDRSVDLLRRGIARGRVSHAYLFSGPAGVGKRTLALEFARALNCERLGPGATKGGERSTDPGRLEPRSSVLGPSSGGEPPCGACRRCRLIGRGQHPEVRVIGVEPQHRIIRIADIAPIQAEAQLRPADAWRKVYIIEQAELLHPDAASRLLKTIEEPPEAVMMILTTVDPEATMETIVSRCQHVRLRPLTRMALAEHLVRDRGLPPERAVLLAALSGGTVGGALGADDDTALEHRAQLIDDLAGLIDGDRVERLSYARGLADRWISRPDNVRGTLHAWLRWWRDVLFLQRGLGERIVNLDRRSALERDAARFAPSTTAAAVAQVRDTLMMLDQNVNARLALDVVTLDLPRSDLAA
jgi:DNA polymerase-3 subunit delta'